MNIITDCSFLTKEQIKNIEELYKAKYICETSIRGKHGGWANLPVALFYSEEIHPQGSNYFAMYFNHNNRLCIANGISALEPFNGLQVDDNVIFSAFRHDYRTFNEAFIDGGREYTRYNGGKLVTIRVVKDHLEVDNA